MHKRAWWVLLLLPVLVWLHAATPVAAASLPDKPAGVNYYDELNVLSDSAKTRINQVNRDYAATKKQPQIGVAVVKSTGGEALSEYAPDLFQKWGIGNKDEDNGVLIVFAKNSGKNNMRIEVGYGLEDSLTDSTAGDILNANLKNIKSSDPTKQNTAVVAVFDAVVKVIDQKYGYKTKGTSTATDTQTTTQRSTNSNGLFSAIVKIIILVVVVIIIIASIGGGGGGGGRRRRGDRGFWLWLLLDLLSSGSRRGPRGFGDGGGFGGGSGWGGGGGSGWGGGSSGGGGADV